MNEHQEELEDLILTYEALLKASREELSQEAINHVQSIILKLKQKQGERT